jgi:hypothetical protein
MTLTFCKKWDFHSEDSDIAFAVYRKQGNELIPIVPHDRVDCDVSPEEGEIDCYDTGVCKLFLTTFSNRFQKNYQFNFLD